MSGFSTVRCAEWLANGVIDPEPAYCTAARSFVDTAACIWAGDQHPATVAVRQAVGSWGGGRCSLAGSTVGVAAPWAALVNGTAAHAAELDDNFLAGGTHASAVLVPALLAMGEERRLQGHAVLDAFVAGLQVQWRLSQAMNPSHGVLGWHPTSTIGAIGAAAAVARLLRFNVARVSDALGLAASMASGSDAQFGYGAKPAHAGLAAKAGILAACMAEAGLTAAPTAIEGPRGLISLTSSQPAHDATAGTFGEPLAINTLGVTMKRWPTCASSHPAIHASIMALAGQRGAEIERVDIQIPEILNSNLKFTDPENIDQAKFSLEFAVATALLDGDVTIQSLSDAERRRPELRSLMRRVHRQIRPTDADDLAVRTSIRWTGESVSSSQCGFDDLPGSRAHPFTDDDLKAKLIIGAAGRPGLEDPGRYLEQIMGLIDNQPISQIAPMIMGRA